MDKSLVLLSKKANLSLCDVLYLPCSEKEGSDWGATKCNNYKKEFNKTSKELIIRHLRSTSEAEFYNHSMKIYQQQLKDHDVQTTLKKYLQIRTKAVKACSSEMSKTAWLKVFMADPRITGKSPTFRLRADNCYLVSPLWVCMQMYCRHSNIDL
ncbi:hypothetical protein EB796_000636 [Bugula neritina]|uniref:Uncharacterized protein n=1 Tax=Bugula neritina TaxID=10212 RepID=A0A7J7KSD5_BUGNE|nr:hypothetical protein EB796_000636 [Bugula neritina]